jgi:hypothetical protein
MNDGSPIFDRTVRLFRLSTSQSRSSVAVDGIHTNSRNPRRVSPHGVGPKPRWLWAAVQFARSVPFGSQKWKTIDFSVETRIGVNTHVSPGSRRSIGSRCPTLAATLTASVSLIRSDSFDDGQPNICGKRPRGRSGHRDRRRAPACAPVLAP